MVRLVVWLVSLSKRQCSCSFIFVCVPFSDLYLFKIVIGMRPSLTIVYTNYVFLSFLFSVGLVLTVFF